MNPRFVDGALPRPATSTAPTGPSPRPAAAATAHARQLAALFTAQMQQSMLDSLSSLGADENEQEDDASGGGDFGDLGAIAGAAGLGSGTTMASANAGKEASLASQLLAAYAAADAARSGAATPAAPPATSGVSAPTGASNDARANAAVVADVARQQGVDPVAAVAMMLVESGGNARAVGDNGTSFGLFQLHEGGMLTAAGLTAAEAFDPRTNAMVSLKSLAHETRKGPNRSPGVIAAASQRPFDPAGYARKVDAAMDRARALLAPS